MASEASTEDGDAGANAAATVAGAVPLALYATWIAADLLARWFVFPVVAVGAGYALSVRPTVREQASYACYALAGLLAVTPVFVVLPDVLSAGEYGTSTSSLLFTLGNLFLVVLFALLAALVAYVGYRVDGGRSVLERVRDARSG